MLTRARSLQARLLPQGLLDALRQIAVFVLAYAAYRLVRGLAANRPVAAFHHGEQVIALERGAHLFVEPALQSWAARADPLLDALSWVYLNAQTTITIGALVWLYLRRYDAYVRVRATLVVAMALALVGYGAFPTAPPRLFPEWGFRDAVASFAGVSPDSSAVSSLFNPYAAIPSMHVAFSLLIGWPLAAVVRTRLARALWVAYPALMVPVVVLTGNHFLVDVVLGAVAAGAGGVAARRLERWRASDLALAEAPA